MNTFANATRICVLVAALAAAACAAAAADDFAGTYANEKLTLVLATDAAGGADAYAGTITVGDQRMPARGTFDRAKGFHGTFDTNGQQFPFSLQAGPDGVVLTSEGATYQLKRAAAARPAANNPAAAAAELPAFLKPGTRITYHAGDSVVQGVGSHLVEKENGGWIDPRTGKTFADDQLRSSGGVGYHELNVVHAARDLVAADVRNFQIVDVARGTATAAGVGGVTGNGEKLADYWVHPARLAALPDERGEGRRVNRVEYPLNGRTHKAISIADTTERSYARTVYDLDTGLLLSRATSTTADNVKTIDPQTGKVGAGRGAAAISHMLLVSVRDLKIPWAAEPAPEWATKGRRLDYQGSYALNAGPGLPPLPPYAMTLSFGLEAADQGVVTAKQLTRSDIGRGLPAQETTSDRCFGSAMFGGAWVGPAALRVLAPNTVVDEDPVTKFRTTYAGVQNNVAVFVVQGPLETSQIAYDPQNGMLVGINMTKATGTGQTVTRLQLSGTR